MEKGEEVLSDLQHMLLRGEHVGDEAPPSRAVGQRNVDLLRHPATTSDTYFLSLPHDAINACLPACLSPPQHRLVQCPWQVGRPHDQDAVRAVRRRTCVSPPTSQEAGSDAAGPS